MATIQYATAAEFDDFCQPATVFQNVPTRIKDLALQWGSRIAASYIKKRKVMPLKSWGEDLKANVCELASYYLTTRRGFKPLSGNNENIRKGYDDAIAWLKDVRTGEVELDDCEDSTTTPDIDEAGPLMVSDEIVDWNYQTRGRRC